MYINHYAHLAKFLLLFCCWVLSGPLVWASTDYSLWVNDIQSRLDKTAQLYQQQKLMKREQWYRWRILRCLKTLRGRFVSTSPRKKLPDGGAFGEIRRMIGEGKSQADVDNKINWLKGELTGVLPVLVDGHKLTAEQQHAAYENSDIAVYWQQSFRIIDDLLAQAISEYQDANMPKPVKVCSRRIIRGLKTLKWRCRCGEIARHSKQRR